MKYEELQYERLGDANKTYPASTLVIRKQFVDAAIEELRHLLQLSEENVDRLTEKLRSKIGEIETLKAENVRLKRALWLARANRAMAEPYSVLNDVLTSNRWVKALNKLEAKAKEYK